jgi:hypothetical protein
VSPRRQDRVVVSGRVGDWKCGVRGCGGTEVMKSWEELRKHVLSHGSTVLVVADEG